MGPKPPNTLRVVVQNISGFPLHGSHVKNRQIMGFINSNTVDICAMSELNVCWHLLPLHERLHERTLGWWETLHISHGYNRVTNSSSGYQKGGVAIFSINTAAHRVIQSGQDPSGLGRWVWTRYRGRHGIVLRVISAYRPVLNPSAPLAVYNQHRRWLMENDDNRCPRTALIEDLCKELQQWIAEGDQIVLGMDVNANITQATVTQPFTNLGLQEVITGRHGTNAPSTHNRGTSPIDAIFASGTLTNIKCGYLTFGAGIPSDHRSLWVDLPYALAFGHDLPPCIIPAARRLKCTDPRTVTRYLKFYDEYLTQHHLFDRAFKLQQRVSYPMTPADAAEWEAIDNIRVQGMKQAENHCRKLRCGSVAWTPELQQAIDVITVWQLVCRKHRGVKVNSKFLHRVANKAGIPAAPYSQPDEAQAALSSAYSSYKNIKKRSDTTRQSWLEGLASALAAHGQTSAAAIYTNLVQQEQQRRDARQIRRVMGKLHSGGLLLVEAPTTDGSWVELTSPTDIATACLQENERRFRQANDTPFMQPPLSEIVGHLGVGHTANNILRGTFVPPVGSDVYAVKLIRHLRMNEEVAQAPPMSTIITTEDHCAGWRRVRERTSSGPSGLHFGHFKAGTTHPLIADFEATMANIPFATGYSPSRWQKGTDVELVKKAGNYKVTDLRTIVLYDAEFNRNNAILGRRLMAHAEKYNQFAPEQYGSRKGRSAIEHGLNKRLTFDLIRQLRSPAAMCSNDAKSCYDRIVHSVATLSMRRLGIPEAPLVSMFLTIQNMQHHVRTSYGDSAESFGGTQWTVPVHGVGQGNGAGPAIWAAVSTPVLNLMREEGFGTFFKTAIADEEIHFVGYAFVDDTDLCETARTAHTTAEDVAERMQAALQCWEGGLRATGGAIVPAKSHWYLIDFEWKDGKWKYASKEKTPAELKVRDARGIIGAIERLPVSQARRTLGIRLAPDGNNEAEYDYLRSQSLNWHDQVKSGHLPRHLAWQALTTSLLPKLRYPLPATTLSRKACINILAPALQAGLPASGIVRTFPRTLVHAPLTARGLNIPDLYSEQGISYIEMLLAHGHKADDITGKLIRGSVQQLKVELGLPGPLFRQDYQKFHQLATESWIKHVWLFLWENSMSMDDPGPHLEARRAGDQFLIQTFYEAGFKGRQLCQLNRCRLYLRVTTLADIANGSGTTIAPTAWQGTYDSTRPHYYRWPAQQRPTTSDWQQWQRALMLAFGIHGITHPLPHPLGSWVDDRKTWQWFHSSSDERLYHQHDAVWEFHSRLPGRASRAAQQRYTLTAYPVHVTNLPSQLTRATVQVYPAHIICTGTAIDTDQTMTVYPKTLAEHIASVEMGLSWALSMRLSPAVGAGIAAALQEGKCIGVSDGSFKAQFGTAAWILVDSTDPALELRGNCIVPGRPSDQSAFRSEVAGLFSLCHMVRIICEYYNIIHGQIQVGCDGKEALYRVLSPDFEPSPRDAHFDLIIATRAAIASTTIKWSYRWVKGHQDDDPTRELDIWARLNVDMDTQAKCHWEEHYATAQQCQQYIQGEPWPVWIGGNKICHSLRTQILDHINGTVAREWWLEKKTIPAGASSLVDWEVGSVALQQSKRGRRHWAVKHSSGFCGVGKMMALWKKWPSANCPRCGIPNETAAHVWTCSGGGANFVWETALTRLCSWMETQETAPEIIEAIRTHLQGWRNGSGGVPVTYHLLGLTAAAQNQTDIGWQCFLEGFVTSDWAATQQTYYTWIGSRRTGKRWAIALVKKLWDVAWDLWEHRNGHAHKASAENQRLQQLATAIRSEYAAGHAMLAPSDRVLFNRTCDQLLDSTIETQQAWLDLIQAARRRAQRRDHVAYQRERTFMSTWLTGVRPNNGSTAHWGSAGAAPGE